MRKFLLLYLKYSIAAGLVGLLYPFRMYLLLTPKPIYYFSWLLIISGSIVLWVYTGLSVYALINFTKNKFGRITLILPIIEIISVIFSLVFGVISGTTGVSFKFLTTILDILISLFVIILAAYLLKKFK